MNTEWTPQELEKYLGELESWLKSERSAPSEGMEQFFAKRLNGYDQNHLENWPWEYENIARYFDDGLGSLLDIQAISRRQSDRHRPQLGNAGQVK